MYKIKKRDNKIVKFNKTKIEKAILKAFLDDQFIDHQDYKDKEKVVQYVKEITERVIFYINKTYKEDAIIDVEEIQNIVEDTLMKSRFKDVAKSYIRYRHKRELSRNKFLDNQSKFIKTVEKITFQDSSENDLKRENANVDGNTAMGTMLQYGSNLSKEFATTHLLDERFSEAHKDGDIHIHDLDFYNLTTTCCQIDLDKLFKGGFSTGHGFVREPQSIMSYASLTAIAIQANQNDQHGGQSINSFDFYLKKGVIKSFRKIFKEKVEDLISLDNENCNLDEVFKYINNLETIDLDKESLKEISDKVKVEKAEKIINLAYKKSLKEIDKQTYQAMESLVHNLNTMNSRAGSQVPFSSINFGTDISPEGRLVSKNLLLAMNAGLGRGETAIFPILIFKVKEGINYNPEDPNYDLFKLAIKVSAKRLFPNFSFIDAPFNLQYYKEGQPETEVAYMGCVQGKEVITYKIEGQLYVEGIKRAYQRISEKYKESLKRYGITKYVDLEDKDVTIYDTNKKEFVKCKKILENPNKHNWLRVKLDNGRCIELTEDHPLPIEGKGRTLMSDVKVGDKVFVTYDQYSEESLDIDVDKAYLLGVLLCDGSYQGNINISLGLDEEDIIEKIDNIAQKLGYSISKKYQSREEKGNYIDVNIKCGNDLKKNREMLQDLFGGLNKVDRQIPNFIFKSNREAKLAFLAGMMDADGYVNNHRDREEDNTLTMNLGSTNKELALQQMLLIQSLGYPCKVYMNNYNKKGDIRYLLHFEFIEELLKHMVFNKKKTLFVDDGVKSCKLKIDDTCTIVSIDKLEIDEESYDVETESDMFDVSGILSHNCRTRVMSNVNGPEISSSRGNLSFTSINLPRLGIKHGIITNEEADMKAFYKDLERLLKLVREQLRERYGYQIKRRVKNSPFLMGQGVWIDSEKLDMNDTLEDILKHGTLTIGFIGLAECLIALTGKHHGESEESQKLGLEIIKFMRDFCDKMAEVDKLNYSLIATPAEGLSGRFVKIDKEKYGSIPRITDKDYYTNSFHVPVNYNITAFKKINIEAPYHALTNAGHISYVELDGDPLQNLEAFEKIVRAMKESGVGYGSINHPVDRDPVCGYTGIIGDECPQCGRIEDEHRFERIRRITGYLVGTLDRFNDGKKAEERDRVKHL